MYAFMVWSDYYIDGGLNYYIDGGLKYYMIEWL